MDYRSEAPEILKSFLVYHETIKGHSKATVDEYYLDLRNFFRFLKLSRGLVPSGTEFDDISISDVDLGFVSKVTLTEVYDYLSYLARDRVAFSGIWPVGCDARAQSCDDTQLFQISHYKNKTARHEPDTGS